jgi:hypothetical protein
MVDVLSWSLLTVLGLFAGMLLSIEIGRRIGRRRRRKQAEGSIGVGAVDGAVFGLMGLLIAFTFSGAASRFDHRRQLIVEETNAVSTAYLRLDLLQPAARAKLQQDFRAYLDARLSAYRHLPDIEAAMTELVRSAALQADIWAQGVAAAREAGPQATMLLLPALNAMIDITTTRTVATQIHPPSVIFVMLIVLALLCALLAGHGMSAHETRSWLHMAGFAAIMSLTIYIILDLEYPRHGMIRVDAADEALADLRESFK